MRSSPERDGEINFVAGDPKPIVSDMDTVSRPALMSCGFEGVTQSGDGSMCLFWFWCRK